MNDTYVEQIGGNHYQKDYQHWTFVTDDSIPYLLAVATKYMDRWRTKNGIQDLRKAITYLKKSEKMDVNNDCMTTENFDKFTIGMIEEDKDIISRILYVDISDFSGSIKMIEALIEKYDGTEEAGLAYVNQD